MPNILEQLYDGNIRPADIDLLPESEYKRIDDEFSNFWQRFFKSIPPESKGLFFEMENKMNELQYLRLRSAFVMGFRLGAKLTMESMK